MKNRCRRRPPALVLAALLLAQAGAARAADPPAAPAAPAAPAGATKGAQTKDAATGPKPADGKPSPLRFEPTEKTRADFEVSFPTDI